MKANGDHIILFDGVCNLCNGAVQYVIRRDEKGMFRFASLQSEAGKDLLVKSGLPQDHLKSFVYIHGDRIYTRSTAALKVAKELTGPVQLLYGFIIIPIFIRDFVYDLIARNRHRLFGRKDACMLPSPESKQRFIG
ncbi:thiol-disulfide oxidoreductase DCC family protein [Niabella hibiscisoli]|uniref:thiol-disulfide oxidoreductase DCC family protein n=1 Tax=Niabella hibiscisoli TaxID=1825928 RepID=UPI001F0D5DE9|nr:thiol-disulfide oxidoreductase DCC family protein [Niabella hibiscisoli]MCH5714917.1 thiol-disulfide oxidoreductase DCC family protein [Niabella hibiscisoli]